jgi:sulfite exporter TauE/SafE
VAERNLSTRESLKLGIYFNIPRIVLLTVLGALIGILSFMLMDNAAFLESLESVAVMGYMAVGGFLVTYGFYMLVKALDQREMAVEEGRCAERHKIGLPQARFFLWITERMSSGKKSERFMLLWGSLLGLACIGEAVLAVELAFLAGFATSYTDNVTTSATLGAIIMFFFAMGASIPVMAVMGLGSRIPEKARDRMLNNIQIGSSCFMMFIGFILILMMAVRIL